MEDLRTPIKPRRICCCLWEDCSEIAEAFRGTEDVWGQGNAIVIRIPSKQTDKSLALKKNLVHHFKCPGDRKEYTVARHHWPRSLLTATLSAGKKWTTPLLPAEARVHDIHEASDSFLVDGSRRMYVRA